MTTHSSILAWKIQWTEEPSGLQFMESDVAEHLNHHWQRSSKTYRTEHKHLSHVDVEHMAYMSLTLASHVQCHRLVFYVFILSNNESVKT